MNMMRVASSSDPKKLAGALTAELQNEDGKTALKCIGAGALNQAIKAVAIARGHVVSGGNDIITKPSFADAEVEGNKVTAIKLEVDLV